MQKFKAKKIEGGQFDFPPSRLLRGSKWSLRFSKCSQSYAVVRMLAHKFSWCLQNQNSLARMLVSKKAKCSNARFLLVWDCHFMVYGYGGLWRTLLDNPVTALVTGVIKKTSQLNFQLHVLHQLISLSRCSQIVFYLLVARQIFLFARCSPNVLSKCSLLVDDKKSKCSCSQKIMPCSPRPFDTLLLELINISISSFPVLFKFLIILSLTHYYVWTDAVMRTTSVTMQ